MYAPPQVYNNLRQGLGQHFQRQGHLVDLLLRVELGLYLLEFLGLDDEPITGVWVLLSGTPIYQRRLAQFGPDQRKAIANARQLVPYASRVAWEQALRSYCQQIPDEWRIYEVNPHQPLNTQFVQHRAGIEQPTHLAVYQACLTERLPYKESHLENVRDDKHYYFEAVLPGEKKGINVTFSQAEVAIQNEVPTQWLRERRQVQSLSVDINCLETVARFLDERENNLAEHYSLDQAGWQPSHWHRRWREINYCAVQDSGSLGQPNQELLTIEGFANLVGMVGVGKTTLALLLLAYLTQKHPGFRATLIVQDVPTALRLANQINWWFRANPETDTPVAVPLLGSSTREKHLKDFYASEDYQQHLDRRQPHWGERWLKAICPLQAALNSRELEKLGYESIIPGHEPCQNIKKINEKGRNKGEPGKKNHLCPFFAQCPSKQLYFDMPLANIWITTPGALAQAGLPSQLEGRRVKLGELVYEQSDLVILDEAETVMTWFDDVYAEQLQLTNGGRGLLDKLERQATEYYIGHRNAPPDTLRWIHAVRDASKAVSNIIIQLNEGNEHMVLEKWVAQGSFSAYNLFHRLARLLAGVKEFDEPQDNSVEAQEVNRITGYFDELLEIEPLRNPALIITNSPVGRLAYIMQCNSNIGEGASELSLHEACLAWITEFVPHVEQNLQTLQQTLATSERDWDRSYQVDTVDMLAHRLQFILDVALLDYQTQIVFEEWANRPPNIDEQPPYRIPTPLQNVLPLPPLGRQFGIYSSKEPKQDTPRQPLNDLKLFAYVNIGRSYILNYPRLRSDLEDGLPGPNVLALSGTSWLPHSTRFHLPVRPIGVLQPTEESRRAISHSQFYFLPQLDSSLPGKPIRVSGRFDKQAAMKELMTALMGNPRQQGGQLTRILEDLARRATENPDEWADRQRLLLLVNSYDQARWAAQTLRSGYFRNDTFDLLPAKKGDGELEMDGPGADSRSLQRSNIENFARTGGRILVAPTGSIGRGFNILNEQGKAAFGAVLFLTRPMPQPVDAAQFAQELNRRCLKWADDPEFAAWQVDSIYARGQELRRWAARYWRSIERRKYYRDLRPDETFNSNPRYDLAATTAGTMIQAAGRLLRGGVPFLAYFVDAAWGPETAKRQGKKDNPHTSLLAAMLHVLNAYRQDSPIGQVLYEPITNALEGIVTLLGDNQEDFHWQHDESQYIQEVNVDYAS